MKVAKQFDGLIGEEADDGARKAPARGGGQLEIARGAKNFAGLLER